MIQIAASKVRTNGVLIAEPVYIRTMQYDYEGIAITGNLKYRYNYKAYLKSAYDAITPGTDAPSIDIQNASTLALLSRDNEVLISETELLDSTDLKGLSEFYNLQYYDTLINSLGLTSGDLSQVPLT